MTDPISAASGIIALVSFGFQASTALYQTIASLKAHGKVIRELKKELSDLNLVLKDLQDVVKDNGTSLFPSLHLPLYSCGLACKEFTELINGCAKYTTDSHSSLRDWAKTKYLDDDITAFKDSLASYKSTIQIALGSCSLQTSIVTAELLQDYTQLIADTEADLRDRLEGIDEKLKALSSSQPHGDDSTARRRIQEEKQSVQRCLEICSEVSACIASQCANAGKANALANLEAAPEAPYRHDSLGNRITADALAACSDRMKATVLELQSHLQEIERQQDSAKGRARDELEEQKRSVEKCLETCAAGTQDAEQARINVFEDVSAADDSRQMIVSTMGDLISARRVTVGAHSIQIMGQMTDVSLQSLSSRHSDDVDTGLMSKPATDAPPAFEGRYGQGRNLGVPDLGTNPKRE